MEHIVYVHYLFRVLVSTKRGVSDSLEFAHSKVSESNGTYQGLKNANWGTLEMLTRKQYELPLCIRNHPKTTTDHTPNTTPTTAHDHPHRRPNTPPPPPRHHRTALPPPPPPVPRTPSL